jgi:hypothetical protein
LQALNRSVTWDGDAASCGSDAVCAVAVTAGNPAFVKASFGKQGDAVAGP